MRLNFKVTLTPGTAKSLATLIGAGKESPVYLDRYSVQMAMGGSGVGYVMDGVPLNTNGDKTNASHVTAELAAATATAPGGQFEDRRSFVDGAGIDARLIWVDGDQADPVRISVDRRV